MGTSVKRLWHLAVSQSPEVDARLIVKGLRTALRLPMIPLNARGHERNTASTSAIGRVSGTKYALLPGTGQLGAQTPHPGVLQMPFCPLVARKAQSRHVESLQILGKIRLGRRLRQK